MYSWILLVCAAAAVAQVSCSSDSAHIITWNHTPGDNVVLIPFNADPSRMVNDRPKRQIIEEDKHNFKDKAELEEIIPWMPESILDEDKASNVPSITTSESIEQALPLYITTEKPTEKPGRGTRMASNDNWVKLTTQERDMEEKETERLFAAPQTSDDFLNSRMPRVNFVTQNKRLETSESRNERESVPRKYASSKDDLRTDFVYPGVDSRARSMKEVYPRQALYYPEEDRRRRPYYDDGYYPEDVYRRDGYYDLYDRRDVLPYSPMPSVDRLDPSVYESYVSRKPKRIIYYAHLPEVVRSAPSVDMRYKYAVDPYRRYDDEHVRTGRYDPRFRPRYSYLKKDERARDLIGSSTKEKPENKVIVPDAPVKKDEAPQKSYNNINSHQYFLDNDYRPGTLQSVYPDVVRSDQNFLRYDVPSFQAAIDDPYADRN